MHIIIYADDERTLEEAAAPFFALGYRLTGKIIAGEVVLVARGR